MNKISRIGAYVLGAALGIGCSSTYNQSDLYEMIADRKIESSDHSAFVNAERTLKDKLATAEGEERKRAEALLSDVSKVINLYKNGSDNIKIRLQPVFEFYAPNGEHRNYNGSEDSGEYIELTLKELRGKFDEKDDQNIATGIFDMAASRWEPISRNRNIASRQVYRVFPNQLKRVFGSDAVITDRMSVLNLESYIPGTTAVRAIVNYGVDVTDADLEGLTNLRPVEPAEEKQPKSN